MAIDTIARGLATSLMGSDGRLSSDKAPVVTGTAELSGFTSIGKLTDPTLIEGRTTEEILLMMLYGVVNPTFTNPSLSIAMNDDMAQPIIGRPSLLKGTLTFDRGLIDPAYGTSGYRAGLPNHYSINDHEIESTVLVYDFEMEVTPTSDIVLLEYAVRYDAGDQPLNSIGQEVDKPLPAGMISGSLELTAAYPLYNADGADHPFEWFKDEDGSGYLSMFSTEMDGTRQSFAVSSATTVVGVKAFNALTQRWEWIGSQTAAISLTYFDTSRLTGESLGETTDYIVYTYNSTPVGARELRIYVK